VAFDKELLAVAVYSGICLGGTQENAEEVVVEEVIFLATGARVGTSGLVMAGRWGSYSRIGSGPFCC
jgi:hypothetical protein